MRPTVTVNCAASIDGKIAVRLRRQTRLSSSEDLERLRALRAGADAILVGVGTVLADDPGLLAPLGSGKRPLRIVLDSKGRTPPTARVLDGRAPTLIVTAEPSSATFPNAEVLRLGRGRVDLGALLDELGRRGVARLLVEGGGEVIHSFLAARLADELFVFVADLVLGGRDAPTLADGEGASTLEEAVRARFVSAQRLEGGLLLHYRFGDAR
ncbi:MAG TPA: 2,5-diamino-6-(ribosylamino)-4(3H)-pyrimidinone 5'-phosphate reductase [Candidatus Thermoplasmatota archaeon]|nr:2,5-diamino-6-(ribosylamino)-4(3H)-pyrimidinone 5'-phosphate reductase [Candidatus Thermoplasmatota archaeon]